MKLHELVPNPGSKKNRKRVGRGISAGQGKTAGRGTKGQGSRSGEGGRMYRQGGNLPFYRRLAVHARRGLHSAQSGDVQRSQRGSARAGIQGKCGRNAETLAKRAPAPGTTQPCKGPGTGRARLRPQSQRTPNQCSGQVQDRGCWRHRRDHRVRNCGKEIPE